MGTHDGSWVWVPMGVGVGQQSDTHAKPTPIAMCGTHGNLTTWQTISLPWVVSIYQCYISCPTYVCLFYFIHFINSLFLQVLFMHIFCHNCLHTCMDSHSVIVSCHTSMYAFVCDDSPAASIDKATTTTTWATHHLHQYVLIVFFHFFCDNLPSMPQHWPQQQDGGIMKMTAWQRLPMPWHHDEDNDEGTQWWQHDTDGQCHCVMMMMPMADQTGTTTTMWYNGQCHCVTMMMVMADETGWWQQWLTRERDNS